MFSNIYKKIPPIIQTFRINQSLKNILVLVPLFFTVNIWFSQEDYLGMFNICMKAIFTMIAFFLLSASIYFFNDSIDKDSDKIHPFKKNRPIAKGQISLLSARLWSIFLCILGNFICYLTNYELIIISLGFTILNILYSLSLKNFVIIDVVAISTGFILRAVAGSIAINNSSIHFEGSPEILNLTISPWLYIITGLGALFLALAKRRGELINSHTLKFKTRKTLDNYTIPLLDNLINIVATATLFAYTLYSFSYSSPQNNLPNNNSMMLTIPFVFFGVFRYLYLIHKKHLGEKPEEILMSDLPLLVNIILWLIISSSILLLGR